MFKIKKIVSKILYESKVTFLLFKIINKKDNGQNVRILNYHNTFNKNKEKFLEQIKFYKKNYEIIDFNKLKKFLNNEYRLKKPGLLITFDDGFKGNYFTAKEVLEPLQVGAMFFISPDKIGQEEYMTEKQIKELLKNPIYMIGSHTCTHHRMNIDDVEEILDYEIIESKKKLEKMFDIKIESFCWCGGELDTYIKNAHKKISSVYDYSFMTNNKLIFKKENKLKLQRTNIEDDWFVSLIMFQLCGFLDIKYLRKRKIINKRLR